MAEEARGAEHSLPRAILLSLGISALLYLIIAVVVVLALSGDEVASSTAPLMTVAGQAGWFSPGVFAGIALLAVANGVLLELIMLGRLIYGIARRSWLPAGLAAVSRQMHTPILATLLGGAITFVLTIALPFARSFRWPA